MNEKLITALVDHFNGAEVARFSIALSIPGGPGYASARRFFNARQELGINGYMDAAQAAAAIRAALRKK